MSLLRRVIAHEPEAWRRMVRLYGPLVYRWCRRSGLNDEDTADVVQEVFLSTATHLTGLRGEHRGESFRAWLRAVTRSKVADCFRQRHGMPEAQGGTDAQARILAIPQPVEASEPQESHNEDDLLSHRVLEIVRADFEDRTWQAFWRVAVEGQSPVAVAADLGMTAAAVYKVKSRILMRLRVELDDTLG